MLDRHADRGAHHARPLRRVGERRQHLALERRRRARAGRLASWSGPSLPSPIAQPVTPCSQPSGHQPSRTDRLSTPFIAAFMPEVPHASIGRRGVLSHTSQPRVEQPRRAPCRSSRGTRCCPGQLRAMVRPGARSTALPAWSPGAPCRRRRAARAGPLEQRREALGIAQEEIGALVGRRAPREADEQRVGIERGRRCALATSASSSRFICRRDGAQRVVVAERGCGRARSCQVPTCTPLVIAMIGAASVDVRPHRRGPSRRAARRRRWPRRARRSPATVMLNGSPPISRSSLSTSSQLAPSRREVRDRVHLVARGHRRVRGEHDACRAPPATPLEGRARLHAVGDQLEAGEDRVALVEVVERRRAGGAPAARARRRCRAASPGRSGSPGACRRAGA